MSNFKYINILTKQFLIDKYLTQKQSSIKIAQLIGSSHSTVQFYLKLYKIKLRPTKEKTFDKILTKDFLKQKYCNERLASTNIAKEVGCSSKLIMIYLKRFKIKILYNEKFNPGYIDGRSLKETFCIDCNKQINWQNNRCKSCWHKFSIGNNNGNFKGGKPHCIGCGKELSTYTNERCNKCYRKYNVGKNHPRWLNGISKLPYSFDFTLQLKEEIRKRDNYKCRKCNKSSKKNKKESRKLLPVHHINYNKQDCRKENLLTLCSSCHTKSNTNRDYWFAYYTYIMENK